MSNDNATIGKFTIGPVVIKQRRHTMVCGLVALANYLNVPYEDVYELGKKVSPKGCKEGFLLKELEEVARLLERPLKRLHWKKVRDAFRGDESNDLNGVLGINWATTASSTRGSRSGHWVFVKRGLIIDPDDDPPRIFEYDEYCATYKGTLGWMLVE